MTSNLLLITCTFWTWGGWTAVAAISTIIYTLFTYRILSKTSETLEANNKLINSSNKVAEFNTYLEIKKSMETDNAHKLVSACSDNTLRINFEGTDSFGFYSKQDVRKYIIDPIEDIAGFYNDKLIRFDKINYAYGYTILFVGNNEEIIKLIHDIRSSYSNREMYSGFENLYKEIYASCSELEKNKYRNDFSYKKPTDISVEYPIY